MLRAIPYSIDVDVSGIFLWLFCPKLKITLRYAGLLALNLLAKLCCGVGTGTKVTMFLTQRSYVSTSPLNRAYRDPKIKALKRREVY